ncbi:MAG: Cystathionine beta-lyase [Flavobacteriia bacterium]|nr:MAG: Cystathionine beta-lyase [Flavobacteriia bacterium]
MDQEHLGFGTKAIHGGQEPDPAFGAVMPPVYLTSTYAQSRPGEHKGYEYSRTHNPTRTALERNLASIENGRFGLAFSSGLAAIDAIVRLLAPGDEVVSTNDLYGGTYRLFTKIFERYGIKFTFVDLTTEGELEAAITERTRMVWVETPSNPMMRITDIQAVAELKKDRDFLLVVDNTFATPCLQRPLEYGADIVMHSATKYLGGHSDVVLGAAVVRSEDLHEQLAFNQNSAGGTPGPLDSYLVLRGIKTLHLRMDRHCSSAMNIARWLEAHPKVDRVHYPGLESHKGHEIAARQMAQFGGMLSFTLKSDLQEEAFSVISSLKIFTLAESLGGVESLCEHPASMTHASIPAEERAKVGLGDSLIRLSVGVEDEKDLIADLEQGLDLI